MMSVLPQRFRDAVRPSTGAVLFTGAGIAAAFGVASCCALPLLLSGIGLGGAAFAAIAWVAAPHRTFLLFAAAICLGLGAALAWRQARNADKCEPGDVCSRPAMRGVITAGLAVGTILLVLGYVYV